MNNLSLRDRTDLGKEGMGKHPISNELDPTGFDPDGVGLAEREAFEVDSRLRILRGVRTTLLYALILNPLFIFLDLYRVPLEAQLGVFAVRACLEASLLAMYPLLRLAVIARRPTALGLAVVYQCAFAMIWLSLLFEPGTNPYYAGISLVIFGSVLVPWSFVPTAISGGGAWLTYLLLHLAMGKVDGSALSTFIANNFFMFSTATIATGVNWYAHDLRYKTFAARFQQKRAYDTLHLVNEQLARQHREMERKSRALAEANEQLARQHREMERKSQELAEANQLLARQHRETERKSLELAEANELLANNKAELEKTNTKLQDQYRVKSQFLDNMSHELRTPLTCILTPVEALLAGNVEGELRQILQGIQGSSRQLFDLINDLLDVSKYENREVPLRRVGIQLQPLLQDLLSHWRFTARQKRLQLTIDAPEDLPTVWVDQREINKVLRNLLSNAVKFTPPGGSISVTQTRVGEELEVRVADSGPGISAEHLPRIGTPFFQVDGSNTRAHQGTGLGLALVKHILERHQGSFAIESTVGVGTTIIVRLPLAPLDAGDAQFELEVAQPIQVEPLELEAWETAHGGFGDGTDPVRINSHMLEALPGFDSRPTVLVVEDNHNLVEVLVRILSPSYEVLTAHDGREGLEKIYAHRPQLVLSDVMMPRMTGLELLKAVRQDKALERLPFVMLTAKAEGGSRVEGLWSGASDYITKPFMPQELLARVNNLLRIQGFERYMTQLNEELAGKSETLEGRLHRLFLNTVKMLVAAIDSKDYYTGGHSERVAFFSMILAEPFNFSPAELQTLELGALLHDVGKIGVPDRVLNKPAELTPEEVKIIREHPLNSARILEKAPELTELRLIAVHHHERWDGKGYPYGLKGEETSLFARIVGMADCWDAMVSDRVYRPGMDPEIAVSKARKMAGSQIDPQVVDALCKVYQRLTPPEWLRPLRAKRHPEQDHDPQVGLIQ